MQSLRSEEGQTLVEFALVLPILLLLVLGIFDFGAALNRKNQLNFLANTAARYAEVNSCAPCGGKMIDQYLEDTAVGFTEKPEITFSLPPGGKCRVGDPLVVTARSDFNWLGGVNLPGLPNAADGPLHLTSTVTVRILQAPDATHYTFTPSTVYPSCLS